MFYYIKRRIPEKQNTALAFSLTLTKLSLSLPLLHSSVQHVQLRMFYYGYTSPLPPYCYHAAYAQPVAAGQTWTK